MIAVQPDVVGLVRDVAHGMSDTTSKLTGTVSHVLGHATGDSSFQEEREQNLESCQTSGDHFKAGLINLTSGIFGGVTSILTQPYKGAIEEGVGVSYMYLNHTHFHSLLTGIYLGYWKRCGWYSCKTCRWALGFRLWYYGSSPGKYEPCFSSDATPNKVTSLLCGWYRCSHLLLCAVSKRARVSTKTE